MELCKWHDNVGKPRWHLFIGEKLSRGRRKQLQRKGTLESGEHMQAEWTEVFPAGT